MSVWISRCIGVISLGFVALVAAVALAAGKYIETSTRDLICATCIIVILLILLPMVFALIVRQLVRGVTQDFTNTLKSVNPRLLRGVEQAQKRGELEAIMREHFLKSDQVTAYKWEQCNGRIVYVYETLTKDDLIKIFKRGAAHFADMPSGVRSRREAFAQRNDSLPEKKRFDLLGSIDDPEPCDVYVLPPAG